MTVSATCLEMPVPTWILSKNSAHPLSTTKKKSSENWQRWVNQRRLLSVKKITISLSFYSAIELWELRSILKLVKTLQGHRVVKLSGSQSILEINEFTRQALAFLYIADLFPGYFNHVSKKCLEHLVDKVRTFLLIRLAHHNLIVIPSCGITQLDYYLWFRQVWITKCLCTPEWSF